MAVDPICGMQVDTDTAAWKTVRDGETVYFCCESCLRTFEAGGAQPARTPAADRRAHGHGRGDGRGDGHDATVWICPMDPEVRADAPGPCPICGMPLESAMPTADSDEAARRELADLNRRLWLSVALAAPLVAMTMSGLGRGWVELALAAPVVLWAAWPFHARAWQSIRTWHLNMFTLIGVGVAVSFAYSVAAVAVPSVFPASARDSHGEVGRYFEAAAVIVALVLLGQVLELRARLATGDAVKGLMRLFAPFAIRIAADGRETQIPLDDLRAGDRLRVRPGNRVPADGVVIDGQSFVDESMLSGEPMPVDKRADSALAAGTINGSGALVMRAERVGAETQLARIIALVAEAQRSRAPIQRVADRVAGYFVLAVLAIAALTFALWWMLGPEPRLAHAVVNAVAVLIIACPCALGLATPMSIMVAAGRGARMGVLFKNAEAIERLAEVDTVVFDKTGTITEGRPRLAEVVAVTGAEADARDLLTLTASLERASEHPVGAAIVAGARERGAALVEPSHVGAMPGRGLRGNVGARVVSAGNEDLMSLIGVDVAPLAARAAHLRDAGHTVVFVAADGRLLGLVSVVDTVKATSAAAIQALRADGVRLVMATGDHASTARAVAASLGLTEVRAGVSPADKAALVAELTAGGRTVAMAGDGINDAPALARAHVGIAMATGTDVAIATAAVTLLAGDLGGLVRARDLARRTLANIRQNLLFAFLYNSIGIPVAAGALYPAFGLLLSPMLAAAAMSFSSVSVIANALRLRR